VAGTVVSHVEDPGVRVAELVDGYARRVHTAALAQQSGGLVCSPLGIWLLLAACVSAARGEELDELERALGCSAREAGELVALVMSAPPPALRVAIAVWARTIDATAALDDWIRGLPRSVESGPMPSQAQADLWARERTDGLIDRFPLTIDGLTRVVLASALATRVSWEHPFDVVDAGEHLARTSPWHRQTARLLLDRRPSGHAGLTDTRAAGVVAVHYAVAQEDLTVVSVSADPGVERAAVLDAAMEVAAHARERRVAQGYSLFDLPVGTGHSWELTEQEIPTRTAGERVQRIAGVSMPAWEIRSELDLTTSPAFAASPALEVLRGLIGPRPDDEVEAIQTAVASFMRTGFKAAAVTAFAVRASARALLGELGIERSATLRFDHPYAAVAIAGRAPFSAPSATSYTGLPLFSAWIASPADVDD
jgi:hypothetical protein